MSDTLSQRGAPDTAHPRPVGGAPSSAPGTTQRRALAVVGLVAVAVVSGFLWWLVRHEPTPEPALVTAPPATSATPDAPEEEPTTTPTTVSSGQFAFDSVVPPDSGADCVRVSYGEVKTWFRDHPCERVVRGLYTTRKKDARAVVSIIVVTMPSAERAEQLKAIVDTSGTGNVSDLLRDGSATLPGAPDVAGGSYAANSTGQHVTIIEASFFDGYHHRALLAEISAEALRAATQLR
ncbi:MAG: hypothetical protein ACRDQ7_27490 [Haloechinothrix sp.]